MLSNMKRHALQFAVVREDARVDIAALEGRKPRRVLLVGSGGCTALAFRARFPEADITVVDPNPAQLGHIDEKFTEVTRPRPALDRFNVMDDDPAGLSESGNFEALFRMLRGIVHDLVWPKSSWLDFFAHRETLHPVDVLEQSDYWDHALRLVFDHALLETMFGRAATQHAPRGSYPRYFRRAFERALRSRDARFNPFLHHVFLGHYLPYALPDFLRFPLHAKPLEFIEATAASVDFDGYDFIGLSNIFDWMSDAEVTATTARLAADASDASVIVWRQLNNHRPVASRLRGRFTFDPERGRRLRSRERSHFYSEVHVGIA